MVPGDPWITTPDSGGHHTGVISDPEAPGIILMDQVDLRSMDLPIDSMDLGTGSMVPPEEGHMMSLEDQEEAHMMSLEGQEEDRHHQAPLREDLHDRTRELPAKTRMNQTTVWRLVVTTTCQGMLPRPCRSLMRKTQ